MKLFELITRTWSSHKTVPTLARGEPPLISHGAQCAPFPFSRQKETEEFHIVMNWCYCYKKKKRFLYATEYFRNVIKVEY